MKTMNKKQTKGFTLIEVIVAVFILTVGVGGSFALIEQMLVGTSVAESRLIASYLAQEGIEIVRNIRDTNWLEKRELSGTEWNQDLDNCAGPVGCCEGDYTTDTPPSMTRLTSVASCNFGDLRYLRIDSSGFYSYGSGIQTKFKRKIFIESSGPDKEKVEVVVEWKERNRMHSVEAAEYITNWYEKRRE